MIIPKIVKVLQSLDESQKSTHRKLNNLHSDIQVLLSALGAARKRAPAIKEKIINCSPEELRVALHDKEQGALESAQVGYQLSSAIRNALRPRSNLSREQMEQIKCVLESHKTLSDLTDKNKMQYANIEKAIQMLRLKISQVDKIHAEAKAVMANYVKPKNKIFRPGEP